MSRKARQDLAGAIHFVSAKGKNGELPFDGLISEVHTAVGEAARRSGWELLAKAVKNDGYELLIRTTRSNLSFAMQALQRDLAHRRQTFFPERTGPLFRDRYFSRIISGEDQLRAVCEHFGIDEAVLEGGGCKSSASEVDLARAILLFALNYFDIEEADLGRMPKSTDEKQLIAAFIRENCAVPVDWIARALSMGHPSAASRGIQVASQQSENLKLDLARLQMTYKLDSNP